MVERRADKTRQSAALVLMRERIIFNGMKAALKVDDPLLSTHSLSFSWDNQRSQAARSLARLDRLYLFEASPGAIDRILLKYSIRGDMVQSDHHPVFASVQFAVQQRRATHWKMSSQWFDDAVEDIARLWKNVRPGPTFFSKIRCVTRYYRGFCKTKVQAFRVDEDALIAEVESLTRSAQNAPHDDSLF